MDIYTERAMLLSLLSSIFPSVMWPATDAEPGFSSVLNISMNGRQHTWHIADDDLPYFAHVPAGDTNYWDGHTTEEKYASLLEYAKDLRGEWIS